MEISLLFEVEGTPVLWEGPENPKAILLLAHGAGAPMDTDFMDFFSSHLFPSNIAVLRFEFPYMALRREGHGKRPPNTQKILLETWHKIISYSRSHYSAPIFIGGKSMGGRMASRIADECNVEGLICLGYPFYAPGKTDKPRTGHLLDLKTPTIILQGERDPMGSKEMVSNYSLSKNIEIIWLPDGNHDLKPRIKSGHTHQAHLAHSGDSIAHFISSRI